MGISYWTGRSRRGLTSTCPVSTICWNLLPPPGHSDRGRVQDMAQGNHTRRIMQQIEREQQIGFERHPESQQSRCSPLRSFPHPYRVCLQRRPTDFLHSGPAGSSIPESSPLFSRSSQKGPGAPYSIKEVGMLAWRVQGRWKVLRWHQKFLQNSTPSLVQMQLTNQKTTHTITSSSNITTTRCRAYRHTFVQHDFLGHYLVHQQT